MTYSIKQLADLAGITVRTLHHYDEIGLLKPARIKSNDYRQYGENELLKLQQIMFFRELEFPLAEIQEILESQNFNMPQALVDHRKLIMLKRSRLNKLVETIDQTLIKIKKNKPMNNTNLYDGFSKEEIEKYSKEAKERWGDTKAFKQSQERVKKFTKSDWERIKTEGDTILKKIVENMGKGVKSPEVQNLISRHYESLRNFYDPNPELYRGLADMYVEDKRFSASFEKYDKRLPVFMRDAIKAFCDTQK